MIKVHIFTAHHFLSRLRYQGPAALLGSQQWELKQGFFSARPPPAPPPALLPVNGDLPRAESPSPVLARDRAETLFQCQSSGDRYSPRGTVSVAMLLCYCLAGSGRLGQ
ncbi:hypothetical protein T03_4277 [Trichinella britovi]|uniref:Uncharacterized protein n=1 Tax=Trichinella britovi TaxID=45882 RepID=A0A0V1C8Q0_TRIBR|nr:hypothetical protein T03_4277 [Trichinella britovi]